MSASASKRKRKELEEQGLSAKAVAERKAKEERSKLLKKILIAGLAVAVALAAVFAVISLVNRPSYDNKAAVATVGEEKISVPVYDYFYNLTASNFYNSYSFLVQSGKKLSEQSSFFGEGTLEDYLKETTNTSLQEVLNVCAKAKAEGFKLTDEQKKSISDGLASIKTEAATYGYPSVDKYLAARFGEGCTVDSYEEYINLYLTYTGYASKLYEEFKPTAEEIQTAYEADIDTYDLVHFTYMTSAAESTTVTNEEKENEGEENTEAATEGTEAATEGTEGTTENTEPTTTTYTDEAKAAAKEKAEGYAKEMPEDATSTAYNKSSTVSYFTQEIADWLFDAERKEGDVKVFARSEDEIYFYTVRFDSRDTNDYCRVNANILTITKDKEDAELEEGAQTSEQKHDALLAAIKDGMTDEEFSTAVSALGYSASTSAITKTYSLEEIRDFLFDENRKAGDLLTTFESETTYYVVRYVSTDEETYRDVMVKSDLWDKFYDSIANANEIQIDEDLLKHAYTDLTFNTSSSEG